MNQHNTTRKTGTSVILTLWLICTGSACSASSGKWVDTPWAGARLGIPVNTEVITDVVVLPDSSVAVAGYFWDSTQGTAFRAGLQNAFVALFDRNGILQWVYGMGGNNEERALGIALASQGGVQTLVVCGYSQSDPVYFPGLDTLAGDLNGNVFLLWIGIDGTPRRAVVSGAAGVPETATDVAVAGAYVYVTGTFFRNSGDNSTLFGQPVSSRGGRDIYVAKLDSTGALQWIFTGGGAAADDGYNVAVSNDGTVLVAGGQFSSAPAYFGSFQLNADQYDIFLLRLDPATGTPLWGKAFTGNWDNWLYDLAVSPSGNKIAFTGYYEGDSITIGTTTHHNHGPAGYAGTWDGVAAVTDNSGNVLWSVGFGGEGWDYGYGVAWIGDSLVVVGGGFDRTVIIGGDTISVHPDALAQQAQNAFVMVFYADSGRLNQLAAITSSGWAWFEKVSTRGTVVAAGGAFSDTLTFGNVQLIAEEGSSNSDPYAGSYGVEDAFLLLWYLPFIPSSPDTDTTTPPTAILYPKGTTPQPLTCKTTTEGTITIVSQRITPLKVTLFLTDGKEIASWHTPSPTIPHNNTLTLKLPSPTATENKQLLARVITTSGEQFTVRCPPSKP